MTSRSWDLKLKPDDLGFVSHPTSRIELGVGATVSNPYSPGDRDRTAVGGRQ